MKAGGGKGRNGNVKGYDYGVKEILNFLVNPIVRFVGVANESRRKSNLAFGSQCISLFLLSYCTIAVLPTLVFYAKRGSTLVNLGDPISLKNIFFGLLLFLIARALTTKIRASALFKLDLGASMLLNLVLLGIIVGNYHLENIKSYIKICLKKVGLKI